MKALIYSAANSVSLQDVPDPVIQAPTDAIIKLTNTTICGTDLHIIQGDVATSQIGRVLGHEGVGIVHATGPSVTRFKRGDHVLISCISSCAVCEYCRKGMFSQCTAGGWILGNSINGTQAEYVRVPHANTSLHMIPAGVDEASLVMLSDVFPTALECGIQCSKPQPGSTVTIIGAGPIGLAAIMMSQMYSPSRIIVVGHNSTRLEKAKQLGASDIIDNSDEDAVTRVKELTGGKGSDVVIEAVGIPATFELAQQLLACGGVLANIGVYGTKADIHMQDLWHRNITITMNLVDTMSTPNLLKLVESGKLQPAQLITHRFNFTDIEEAYKTLKEARKSGAIKVLISMEEEQ